LARQALSGGGDALAVKARLSEFVRRELDIAARADDEDTSLLSDVLLSYLSSGDSLRFKQAAARFVGGGIESHIFIREVLAYRECGCPPIGAYDEWCQYVTEASGSTISLEQLVNYRSLHGSEGNGQDSDAEDGSGDDDAEMI
jgi:hypothetical protein